MKYFISCDWGTSSFRLRLIESAQLTVLAEVKTKQGIASTYQSWLDVKDREDRQAFYMQIIGDQLEALNSPPGTPVMLSGMASSTIGLMDIPYKEVPFALDGSDLNVKVLQLKGNQHPLVIISGACTENDVMRGEETKVLGCGYYLKGEGDARLLMPGTHPKHIVLKNRQVLDIKTYMTGEFFDLLVGYSVLKGSVLAGANLEDPVCGQHFQAGVRAGAEGNILHESFMVRTRQVLDQVPEKYNYHYLSGLLIGSELKDLDKNQSVYLVSSGAHTSLYLNACAVLGIKIEQVIDADEALIRGQQLILSGMDF